MRHRGRGPRLRGGAAGGVPLSFSAALRAPRLPPRACGGAGRGGDSRAGRELAPLARVGDGRGGGGGVSVRAA